MSKFETFDFNQAIPIISEDTEFFPLLSQQDEDDMRNAEIPESLSILSLRNTVLFPGVVIFKCCCVWLIYTSFFLIPHHQKSPITSLQK